MEHARIVRMGPSHQGESDPFDDRCLVDTLPPQPALLGLRRGRGRRESENGMEPEEAADQHGISGVCGQQVGGDPQSVHERPPARADLAGKRPHLELLENLPGDDIDAEAVLPTACRFQVDACPQQSKYSSASLSLLSRPTVSMLLRPSSNAAWLEISSADEISRAVAEPDAPAPNRTTDHWVFERFLHAWT